ncbi:MAG: MFS transporter [Oscillospiraceae bacterium]|nr:MFS transporter [Oscillospiraceae bacterium]
MKRTEKLKRHGLFRTLFEIKGNPRICLFTEPLWNIPYNLFSPFATLYMYALGVNDTQIGLILSVGMCFQVAAALFGGVITDKFGRRMTTIIFDTISWSVPCLIWAFAQDFWWFLAAAICNSLFQITNVSWTCLFVEDCEPKHMVNIFTWIQVTGLISVFFAPIATLLVDGFSMVTAVRWIYFFSFLSMTAKFVILFLRGTETEQGRKRMEETKGDSILRLFAGYKDVLKKMLHSPAMMFVVVFMVLNNIYTMVVGNFFGLFVTQNLGVPEQLVAIFPMVRAGVMLLFILLVQNIFNRMKYRPVMLLGLGVYILSHAILLLAPPESLTMIWLYTLAEAFAFALVNPRKDSLSALFIDKEERSRAYGLLYVIIIACSTPFGWLVGWLSSLNRTLPFFLNIAVFAVCILLIACSKTLRSHDRGELELTAGQED